MAGTVPSAGQPQPSLLVQRIRELAAPSRPTTVAGPARAAEARRASAGEDAARTAEGRAADGVPAWKRRVHDELAARLGHAGSPRGARAGGRLTAQNVDERIAALAGQVRARERAAYGTQEAHRTGVAVNRVV